MHDKALGNRHKGLSITIKVEPNKDKGVAPDTPMAGKPDPDEQQELKDHHIEDMAPEDAMAQKKSQEDAENQGIQEGQDLNHDQQMEDMIMQGHKPQDTMDEHAAGKKPQSIGEMARLHLAKKKMNKGA